MKKLLSLLSMPVLLTLVACGSGATDPSGLGTVAGRPTTAPPTTAGAGQPALSTPSAPSAPSAETTVTLFFTKGEQLAEVTRSVPRVARIGAEAVSALLAGPTEEERRAGLSTAIPAATKFNGLTIDGGVAKVDLTKSFETGGSGLGLTLRVAQVTCTLDAFPTVEGVRFALDGQVIDVLSGDGLVLDKPVTCDGYRRFLAQGPAASTPAGRGIWPLVSAADAASADPLYRDPSVTARAFAERYLGMTNPAVLETTATSAGTAEVSIGFRTGEGGIPNPNPRPGTVVQLRQFGQGGPWTVTGATATDIAVTSPAPGAKASSPLALSGSARAFEGTVQVEVREDGMLAGQSLGKTFVTGSGGPTPGPFQGQVNFRTPTKPGGAVVFWEQNMATGGTPVLRATVVRVSFS